MRKLRLLMASRHDVRPVACGTQPIAVRVAVPTVTDSFESRPFASATAICSAWRRASNRTPTQGGKDRACRPHSRPLHLLHRCAAHPMLLLLMEGDASE